MAKYRVKLYTVLLTIMAVCKVSQWAVPMCCSCFIFVTDVLFLFVPASHFVHSQVFC